jgi:general secretion pathway protein G
MDAKGGRAPLDPWNEAYQYRYPGTKNAESYDLFSSGRDKKPDTEDDIGNW